MVRRDASVAHHKGHVQEGLIVEQRLHFSRKRKRLLCKKRHGQRKRQAGGNLADAVVARITDDDVAVPAHCHANRMEKSAPESLARRPSPPCRCPQEYLRCRPG